MFVYVNEKSKTRNNFKYKTQCTTPTPQRAEPHVIALTNLMPLQKYVLRHIVIIIQLKH